QLLRTRHGTRDVLGLRDVLDEPSVAPMRAAALRLIDPSWTTGADTASTTAWTTAGQPRRRPPHRSSAPEGSGGAGEDALVLARVVAVGRVGRRLGRAVRGQFGAGDDVMVHLVGAIGDPQRALAGVQPRQRDPLRHARRAVDLDRLVDDLADALGDHRLDGADPYASLGVAELVHRLGRLEHHQTHRLDLDPAARDQLHVLAE